MNYQLMTNPAFVKRTDDDGSINYVPIGVSGNADSRAYDEWLAVPNTPDPVEGE